MHRGRGSIGMIYPAAGVFVPMIPPSPPYNFNHNMFPVQQPRPFFYHAAAAPLPPVRPELPVLVRPVWAWNLKDEWNYLSCFAAGARYIAVDVHYPGLVHVAGEQQDHNSMTTQQRYDLLKANVDALKPLQLGIAVCDHQGQHLAWEFNLRDFSLADDDAHDGNSLAYLAARGLHVDTHRNHGVDACMLSTPLLGSGLVGGAWHGRPSWVTHNGAYHVAYLLKIITGAPLPHNVARFFDTVRHYLGHQVYDVARMAADCPGMPVGLERVADDLRIHPPWGSPRLAGAAAARALVAFRILKHGGNVEKYRGLLQGLHY